MYDYYCSFKCFRMRYYLIKGTQHNSNEHHDSFICNCGSVRECATVCCLSESERRRSSFGGGLWFNWVSLNRSVSLHPESALSHLLTPSAHCHSNGIRESERLGKANYLRRNTSLTSLCFNSHQGYARNVHCALV